MGIRRSITYSAFIALACVSLGCSPRGDGGKPAPAGKPSNGEQAITLQGKIALEGGAEIDLADATRPTVLIFASDFCAVCSEEARALAEVFRAKGGPPRNVRLLTVLIGAFPEDVAPWVANHSVTWPTGRDDGDALFRGYCPVTQTPCVLTHNPATGKIQTRNGHFSVTELEEETGIWTY